MKNKELKLETYLLFTNFFHGIFWIISGIMTLFNELSLLVKVSNFIVVLIFLSFIIKIMFSPKEDDDELSKKIKTSVDSNLLCVSLPIVLLYSSIIELLEKFDISINISWHVMIKFFIGSLLCLQYIIFIIAMKKISTSNGE